MELSLLAVNFSRKYKATAECRGLGRGRGGGGLKKVLTQVPPLIQAPQKNH
jgi:hypothetical protein